MASIVSADAMPFLIITPAGQCIEEKRKLIRSHVMRGKNRKKRPSTPRSFINTAKINEEIVKRLSPFIPAKVGGELSLAALPAEMTAAMLENIVKLRQEMFPLEVGLSSHQSASSWLEPLCKDAACLHFSLFIAKAYLEIVQGQKRNSEVVQSHLVKALAILQCRLAGNDSERSTSDSTMLVVIGLTMTATAFGDFDTALKHLRGLHGMILLRGGISALTGNRHLQAKVLRADLGVALSTGHGPLFCSDGISWKSYIASRGRILILETPDMAADSQILSSDLNIFVSSLDVRLCNVWVDVSEVVRAANIATQCKRTIDLESYQEVMISIHYRLMKLNFDTDFANETVRLALLAFASTIFLQWRSVKSRYENLAQGLKSALSLLGHGINPMPTNLTLWLYIFGIAFVFDEQTEAFFRPALAELLQAMQLMSWNAVRLLLKSVLWVDVLHDLAAKRIVEATLVDDGLCGKGRILDMRASTKDCSRSQP